MTTVRIADLELDRSYRPDDPSKLARLKARLAAREDAPIPTGLTPRPVVAQRPDGTLFLIDGFARLVAAAEQGYTHVDADVIHTDDAAQEAAEHARLNSARTLVEPGRGTVALPAVFLMYAFRYALGRMTYAVGDVADTLIANRDRLTADWREQIIRDIDQAIELGAAGHQCDVDRWTQVKEAMR
jgi:hypothetical protein